MRDYLEKVGPWKRLWVIVLIILTDTGRTSIKVDGIISVLSFKLNGLSTRGAHAFISLRS